MNPDSLLAAARILAALVLLVLMAQLGWLAYRLRQAQRDVVLRRLGQGAAAPESRREKVVSGRLERVLARAGVHLSATQRALAGSLLLVFLAAVAVLKGMLVALIITGLLAAALWMYWRYRLQKQRRRIYEELPLIIDTTLRYVDAGRSLENALVEAFRDTPPVFEPLAFRLRSAVESGRDYTDLFEDFAELHRVPSLVTAAIALRTSERFGSSIRPVLKQVSVSMRAQQELRREFLAATSEVRFTAAAFALLPMGLAAYMILMNESYSRILLDTHTGHVMLMIAGGLQALGVIVIGRMIQGVGRD